MNALKLEQASTLLNQFVTNRIPLEQRAEAIKEIHAFCLLFAEGVVEETKEQLISKILQTI